MDPDEHYVIGINRAWHDYYNWMMQALPAIDASLRRANHRRITLVLPPSMQPFQEETLRLLGYQDLPRLILDITSHYRFASAEFSDFLGDRMHLSVPDGDGDLSEPEPGCAVATRCCRGDLCGAHRCQALARWRTRPN